MAPTEPIPATRSTRPIRRAVPIEAITEDQTLQIRGGIDPHVVKRYEAVIEEHGSVDDLDLFCEDEAPTPQSVFRLASGYHRLAAYRNQGKDKIPCCIRFGNHSEALEFALAANGRHGAPLTNNQKRVAAEMAVLDPVISAYTDLRISKMIGCSSSLVALARKGEKREHTRAKAQQRQTPADATTSASESPALQPVVAHERKAADNQPTKEMILRQIEEHVTLDMVDEAEVIKLFESPIGRYVFAPKEGCLTQLRVCDRAGQTQILIPVIVKGITMDEFSLKFEGGSISVEIEASE